MLNIYDDITYKWNMYMILIICEVIELRLYVVFNGWYVMYDNIARVIKNCQVTFYADDTVIYSKCKSLVTAQAQTQKDLKSLARWSGNNGIYINTQRTKYMIFGSKVRLAKPDIDKIVLCVNDQKIVRVHTYCYLGITLDEQLNYELHAQSTLKKVRNELVQLRKMRCFLNKRAALMVYTNMILPI